ncbi:MAG TPA: 4Fe-4S dicluster domain-containing protein [Victivallales bacterium]|nr:4Fe-4S dicluster domain-containing protein [Victivallales bacterium]
MNKLTIIQNLCIGCKECELMCGLKHHGVFNPLMARIRVEYNREMNCYDPVICQHCDDPACVKSCRFGALSKDVQTGIVGLEKDKCKCCRLCVKACPHNAIRVSQEGAILKCDLCGGNPTCVKFCSKRSKKSSPLMANPEGAKALNFT